MVEVAYHSDRVEGKRPGGKFAVESMERHDLTHNGKPPRHWIGQYAAHDRIKLELLVVGGRLGESGMPVDGCRVQGLDRSMMLVERAVDRHLK